MNLSGGAFFVSYLKSLTNRQLLSLEDWNKERRLNSSSREDAEQKLFEIRKENSRRGINGTRS